MKMALLLWSDNETKEKERNHGRLLQSHLCWWKSTRLVLHNCVWRPWAATLCESSLQRPACWEMDLVFLFQRTSWDLRDCATWEAPRLQRLETEALTETPKSEHLYCLWWPDLLRHFFTPLFQPPLALKMPFRSQGCFLNIIALNLLILTTFCSLESMLLLILIDKANTGGGRKVQD